MHELSLVRNIFSTIEENFPIEERERISVVELEIGLLANVEPILLQNAFKAYQETNHKYQGVELKTNLVEIKIHCSACQSESIVENYIFKCSSCGQPSSNVVAGEELLIHKLHFRDEAIESSA